MLQQTQVATVIPYYSRFMQRFPELTALANASQDEVLHLWSGLGYYARGRNLHKAAGIIASQYRGQFPEQIEAVNALPGIGRSTAGAILALALNQDHAILDGNVKRVLCRYHGIEGFPGQKKIETRLWTLAEQHTPTGRAADYTQAIMDMGATLCRRSKPECNICPHQDACLARQQDKVASLPSPRPRRSKPAKHRYMLVLSDHNGSTLVFKRPATGIWGGLYGLPEFETEPQWRHFIAEHGGTTRSNPHIAADIQHSFTHFDLRITPVYLSYEPTTLDTIMARLSLLATNGSDTAVAGTEQVRRYHAQASLTTLGLPAPVQKILQKIPAHVQNRLKSQARSSY